MGPRFGGLVVHFGQLKIGSLLGRGSYSKVFRGTMTRSKVSVALYVCFPSPLILCPISLPQIGSASVPVAVKMMWCIDITVDVIQMFVHEVRMLKVTLAADQLNRVIVSRARPLAARRSFVTPCPLNPTARRYRRTILSLACTGFLSCPRLCAL